MITWILYKRLQLSGKKETTFGVDVWEGNKRNIFQEEMESKEDYLKTIAPGETPRGLGELVFEEGLTIDLHDLVIPGHNTYFIPVNNYIEIPATPKEIIEFHEGYVEKLGSKLPI